MFQNQEIQESRKNIIFNEFKMCEPPSYHFKNHQQKHLKNTLNTYPTPSSSVVIVDFEQIYVSWDIYYTR